MKKTLLVMLLFKYLLSFGQSGYVGIGTASPQKDLHIAGAASTIRIEKLNSVNSPLLNAGGTSLSPVYVDKDGEFTLNPPGYSGGSLSGTIEPLNFLYTNPNFIPDGVSSKGVVINNDTGTTTVSGTIITIPFSSPQSALVEVKYGVTVLLSATDLNTTALTSFSDLSARTFQVYFCIDLNSNGLDAEELSKKYGYMGQSLGSSVQGLSGYPYMNGHGYAEIPAGNHSLVFFGETTDGTNKYTSTGFGGVQDYLKIRIFN